jgi:hypothetical protein
MYESSDGMDRRIGVIARQFRWLVPARVYVLQRALLGISDCRRDLLSHCHRPRLGNLVRLVELNQ